MAPKRSEPRLRRAFRRGLGLLLLAAAGLWLAPSASHAHPAHAPDWDELAQLADESPDARGALPEAERRRLEQRMEQFKQLSPEEQERIRKRHEQLQQLPPKERERVRKNYDRWQQLSPEEREQMRQRHERFEKLPPDQRKKLRERGQPEGKVNKQQGSGRDQKKKRKKRDD